MTRKNKSQSRDVVREACTGTQENARSLQLGNSAQNYRKMDKEKFTTLPVLVFDGEKYKKIDLSEVSFIQVMTNHTELWSRSNVMICRARVPISKFQTLLSPDVFIRISRSTIINMHDIDYVIPPIVMLKSGVSFDISRRCLSYVKSKMMFLP